MNHRILITGSSGLVGCALANELERRGADIRRFDLREGNNCRGDVRDSDQLAAALQKVSGVVHLAAVSRVLWGERNPDDCWATNVGGTRNLLELAGKSSDAPWVIFASSREVYGQADVLPVDESSPLRPVNVYGRSKAAGERLVEEARSAGLRASTIRLSNVFGSADDHADRVVPAFARGAIAGGQLRIDGANHTFDFTFIDDVARGIASLVDLLGTGAPAPRPIHLVSGRPTTLGELAELTIHLAGTKATVAHARPRDFDVERFVGDGERARKLLGWQPRVDLREGLRRLICDLRDVHGHIPAERTEALQ